MWLAIQYVSSGFTLCAFVVAAIFSYLKYRAQEERKRIETAPAESRASLVAKTLEIFDVDTSDLTRQQQYDIAMKQIGARIERFRIIALVVVILASLGTGISVLALSKGGSAARGSGSTGPGGARDAKVAATDAKDTEVQKDSQTGATRTTTPSVVQQSMPQTPSVRNRNADSQWLIGEWTSRTRRDLDEHHWVIEESSLQIEGGMRGTLWRQATYHQDAFATAQQERARQQEQQDTATETAEEKFQREFAALRPLGAPPVVEDSPFGHFEVELLTGFSLNAGRVSLVCLDTNCSPRKLTMTISKESEHQITLQGEKGTEILLRK